MSTDNVTVKDQVFHVRVVGKIQMPRLPNPMVTPAGKPLVHAVPLTIFFRQEPPLGSGARNPENGFKKETTACFLAHIGTRMSPQEGQDFVPLRI